MSKHCCSGNTEIPENTKKHTHQSGCSCCNDSTDNDGHSHNHTHSDKKNQASAIAPFVPALISAVLLFAGIALDHGSPQNWFSGWIRFGWYGIAYIPVGIPVMKEAVESIRYNDFFSEFFLMSIATIGAFAIGEYPEGVTVMLFYSIGEAFQGIAVKRAKKNIQALLDQRPDQVTILENGQPKTIQAEMAKIGQRIQLKPGESLTLDGELASDSAAFNTAALTGESKPDTKKTGDEVLAGMINLNTVSEVIIRKEFKDSKLSKILELVQNATSQKAKTELFIRKFAHIYTPIVTFLALAIFVLPYFFVQEYDYKDWLYRACIFLVISCPCALVISIPLGYFGGIGAGSRNGILFKGSNFLDILGDTKNMIFDKTGTLTEGVFRIKEVVIEPPFNRDEILKLLNCIEGKSTHPIATAVHEYAGKIDPSIVIENVEEFAGYGLKGSIDGNVFLAGNFRLLDKFEIPYSIDPSKFTETLIALAFDGRFAGYLTISDHIKEDAADAISQLKKLGVTVTMLSGDKTAVVKAVAQTLGIRNAYGDMLPEDKVNALKKLKANGQKVAFAGDGANDAPVVALSDVGIAMGGLGSDATIETADVVIQDDRPSKIPVAIKIGRATKKIVWQNITLAFVVKAAVLILGAGGLATMWEAVFADVGVALLAILNAIRIQNMKFRAS